MSIATPEIVSPQDDDQRTCHPTSDESVSRADRMCPIATAAGDPDMQEVDPELLRTDIQTRMTYLKDFLGFRRHDQDMLNKVAPMIYDSIPPTVDRLYSKLFEFDVTKEIFLKRNEGFEGVMPSRIEDLSLDSPQLVYRKIFMKAWCRRVLTADYTSLKTFQYLDKVGIMHTGAKPFKHRVHTEPLIVHYRDCALTLGWVLTVIQTAILSLTEEQLNMTEKMDTVAAINKVIWMQNDLFARHYIIPTE